MATQYELYTGIPPHNHRETSKNAAEAILPLLGPISTRVYEAISNTPRTCDEVEIVTGLSHQTASARVRELQLKDRIVDSGQRRKTRSGRAAIVWTISERK